MDELLKKLTDEKFEGNAPEWKEARWGDIEVLCAQDDNNWYYDHEGFIYIQAKKGDHTPHCYGCGSEIEFKIRRLSVWFDEFKGPVGGGDVKTKHIPYCLKCEEEPRASGIIIDKL